MGSFLALLVVCSVMVVRQFNANQSRHTELREAFILLHSKGYTNQAQRLYYRLLIGVERLPNNALYEDFQRTMMLVDPTVSQPRNPVWKYHWIVSKELEKRSARAFERAVRLAEDTP